MKAHLVHAGRALLLSLLLLPFQLGFRQPRILWADDPVADPAVQVDRNVNDVSPDPAAENGPDPEASGAPPIASSETDAATSE